MPQRRVFVSDSFAVLQEALVTAVAAVKDADPLAPTTVITTSAPLALRLRRAVAWAGQGHFALQVCTLTDLARNVAEERLLQEGKRPLPLLAAPLLMRRFLVEQEADNYFAPLASLPGFPSALLATFMDLQQACISPQLLREFLGRTPQGEISRRKLTSLLSLYEHYLYFLVNQGFYDVNMVVDRAISLLETDSSDAPLFLYGFYDFTPLQRRLIAAAVAGRDAVAFLPWRSGVAYSSATPTLTWFANLGFQSVALGTERDNEDNLSRLQAGLFEERTAARAVSPNKADQSVAFLSTHGKSQEAREIGRIILDLVRMQGVRFREIGVFLRDPNSYEQLLVETFQSLEIPAFLHGGLPLIRTQAGQRFLLLCQVLLEEYARSRVIEFLRGAEPPFTELLGAQATAARLTQWEAFSLQAGIVKGAEEWRDRLSRFMLDRSEVEDEDVEPSDPRVLGAFFSFMDGFLAASEQKPLGDSWRGWSDFVLQLMRKYVSPTEHTGGVEEVLLKLAELDHVASVVSFAEWVRSATSALTAASVPVGALDKEGVFIGDLLAARGIQFRAVFIPGMVDGSFPRFVRQDPLLLDQERQYLSEVLSCELRPRRGLSETEQLLFLLAIHSAREWVVFSYPSRGQSGDLPQTPSFFLLRALEALTNAPASFADLHVWERQAQLLPSEIAAPSKAVDSIEYHLLSAAHAVASGASSSLGYLPTVSPFFTSAFHALRQRWHSDRLTVFDGMIDDGVVKEKLRHFLFPTGVRLSASALETYARCPFRYFLHAVLQLDPSEEPERVFTLQPRDRGALLHDILHDFFTRVRADGKLPLTPGEKNSCQRLLRTVAEEHFNRFAKSGATGLPLLWDIERERMLERLRAFLEGEFAAGETFLPAAFEVQFGMGTVEEKGVGRFPLFPDGPVRLSLLDGEEIALRGRIDRIDLSDDQQHARIVDYKSGKLLRGRFAGGTALQLPLYLYAAQTLWPEKIWESATYTYVDQKRKTGPPLFTLADWEDSLATLKSIVTKLTQSMHEGCFTMTPESCFPCPFPLICGGLAERRAALKQQDVRLDLLHVVRAVE